MVNLDFAWGYHLVFVGDGVPPAGYDLATDVEHFEAGHVNPEVLGFNSPLDQESVGVGRLLRGPEKGTLRVGVHNHSHPGVSPGRLHHVGHPDHRPGLFVHPLGIDLPPGHHYRLRHGDPGLHQPVVQVALVARHRGLVWVVDYITALPLHLLGQPDVGVVPLRSDWLSGPAAPWPPLHPPPASGETR